MKRNSGVQGLAPADRRECVERLLRFNGDEPDEALALPDDERRFDASALAVQGKRTAMAVVHANAEAVSLVPGRDLAKGCDLRERWGAHYWTWVTFETTTFRPAKGPAVAEEVTSQTSVSPAARFSGVRLTFQVVSTWFE